MLLSALHLSAAAATLLPIGLAIAKKPINVPILAIGLWLFQALFFQGLNFVFWKNNFEVKYLVYCDISTSNFTTQL